MASGCIIGKCPVCDELIWEDEWDMIHDKIIHTECRKGYIKTRYGMDEAQFLRLMGAQELKKDIAFMKEGEKERRKLTMECLSNMEKRLKELEKVKEKNK